MSNEKRKEESAAAPARGDEGEARARWSKPRITDHGSLKHLVRGSTGPHGDKGTPIGKRS